MKLGAHQIPKFDPFNMTGLPDHILAQLTDDFYFWYNDYAMRQEFQLLELRLEEARKTTPIDPYLQDLFDRGLISQGQLDQVTILRGKPLDIDSNFFMTPAQRAIIKNGFQWNVDELNVVPPDRMVPMTAPGSMDRLRHYEEGALDRTIKGGEFLPKVTGAFAVGADGVKRDLRDIDFLGIALGTSEPAPIEGEHLDGEVDRIMQKSGLLGDNGMLDLFKVAALSKRNVPIEGEVVSPVRDLSDNLNRRDYGILIRESLDSEGNVEYHLGEPNEKPMEGEVLPQYKLSGRAKPLDPEQLKAYCEQEGIAPPPPPALVERIPPRTVLYGAGEIILGEQPLEGQIVDKGVEVRIIPDDYEFPPHVSKPGDGYKLDHIAPLPSAQGTRPLISGTLEMLKGMSQGRGRDETMAVYMAPELVNGIDELTPKFPGSCEREPEVLTPEEIADREQAIQEASEGKLDYLLEGTQWDPKLRK